MPLTAGDHVLTLKEVNNGVVASSALKTLNLKITKAFVPVGEFTSSTSSCVITGVGSCQTNLTWKTNLNACLTLSAAASVALNDPKNIFCSPNGSKDADGFYIGNATQAITAAGVNTLRLLQVDAASGNYSQVLQTKTVNLTYTMPATPTVTYQTLSGSNIRLNWSSDAAAVEYRWRKAESAAPTNSPAWGAETSNNTAISLAQTVTPGRYFYYQVKACNQNPDVNTRCSAWSQSVVIAQNDVPTISAITAKQTNEDIATSPIAFTVNDLLTPNGGLTVTASSSNTALVAVSNITLGGSGSNRTVTITPKANQHGAATITLTVSDGSLSASTSFQLTVTAVNDWPTISDIADRTISEDGTSGALAFTVNDIETAASALTITKASSNTSLIGVSDIVISGSGNNRTVQVTPKANQNGMATITLTVSDGLLTASDSFKINVGGVNDSPTITGIGTGHPHIFTYVAGHALAGELYTGESYSPELEVLATDIDGDALTYQWSVIDGQTYFNKQLSPTSTATKYQFLTNSFADLNQKNSYITIRIKVTDTGGLSTQLDKKVYVNYRPRPTITGHNAPGIRENLPEFASHQVNLNFTGKASDVESHAGTLYRNVRRLNEATGAWGYWHFGNQNWSTNDYQKMTDYVAGTVNWAINNTFGANQFPPKSQLLSTGYRYYLIAGQHDTDWIFGEVGQGFYINAKPQITGQQSINVMQGSSINLTPAKLTIVDADDTSGFSLKLGAASASCPMDNYAVSGLTITPTSTFHGGIKVPLIINDGTEDSEVFCAAVTVDQRPNTAPTFTSTPITTANAHALYEYTITTSDAENDTVTLQLTQGLSWLSLQSQANGTAKLKGTPNDSQLGSFPIIIQATDNLGASRTQSFTLKVEKQTFQIPKVEYKVYKTADGTLYLVSQTTDDVFKLIKQGDTTIIVKISRGEYNALSTTLLSGYRIIYVDDDGDGKLDLKLMPISNLGLDIIVIKDINGTTHSVIVKKYNRKVIFIHTDLLGSPAVETDEEGKVR